MNLMITQNYSPININIVIVAEWLVTAPRAMGHGFNPVSSRTGEGGIFKKGPITAAGVAIHQLYWSAPDPLQGGWQAVRVSIYE